MTNQLLQSDIDLAKRLIQERHTDEEILGVLLRRRVAPEKALHVLAALRAGEQVEPDMRINYELGEGLPDDPSIPAAPAPEPYVEPSPHRRKRSKRSGGWKLWASLIVAALLGGAALYVFLLRSGAGADEKDADPKSSGTGGVPEAAPAAGETPSAAAPGGPPATPSPQ
jgi:hypothetical protein